MYFSDKKLGLIIDIAKIVGGVVKDTVDTGDYRLTLIVEKKIDDKNGVVVSHVTVDKKMSKLQVDLITKRLKTMMEKDI